MQSKLKSMLLAAIALLLPGIIMPSGCGDGENPCGEPPTSCDVDPTGSFELVAICGFRPLDCPDATSSVSLREAGGSLTINADGTGSISLDLEYSYSTTVPKSCGYTCEELDETIGLCDDDGDNCSCRGIAEMSMNDSFDWRVEGDEVILEFSSPGETGTLCVSGDIVRSHTYDGLELKWQRGTS